MRKDIKSIKKVRKYRRKGLSFREISKLLDANLNQVYRWSVYDVYSYPLKKRQRVLTRV